VKKWDNLMWEIESGLSTAFEAVEESD